MVEAPIIETARLRLRLPTMSDWPPFLDLMRSERAVYMGGPFTTERAWWMFCECVAQWSLMGYGALTMEDKDTGQRLGQVELNDGPLFPETELGWQVYEIAEGKSYAYEAALALRDWAFNERGLNTLVSYIDPGNTRSRRLAERLGAHLDNSAERQDPTDLVYRHDCSTA